MLNVSSREMIIDLINPCGIHGVFLCLYLSTFIIFILVCVFWDLVNLASSVL